MFRDVGRVLISRIGGPNCFAQGCEAKVIARGIKTTMQRMSHPVRRLSSPPDIALESISQTTLGLPASRPVKTPGGNQHRSVSLKPRWSCRNQSPVRKFATDDSRKMHQKHTSHCMIVCTKSAYVCKKSAVFILCILAYDNKKVCETQTFILFCIMSA
jgi:hypothetical protein